MDTTPNIQHITHGDGPFPHQTVSATSGLFGSTYNVDTVGIAPGSSGNLGCHDHTSATYVQFTVQ